MNGVDHQLPGAQKFVTFDDDIPPAYENTQPFAGILDISYNLNLELKHYMCEILKLISNKMVISEV